MFQLSPGVNVSEIDLTTVVPAVSTTAGAFAGQFQWGPVNKRTLITHETMLVDRFNKPNDNCATSWFSAANFLAYGNNLQVVRAANTASNNSTSGVNTVLVQNEDVYDAAFSANNLGTYGTYVARYPGGLGASLNVSVCSGNTYFSTWKYASNFTSAPNTSTYVTNAGGAYDQMHIAVVDEDGLFTGTKGTVLEVFPFVSKATNALNDDGSTAYYRNVIREQSKYVYAFGANNGSWDGPATTSFTVVANADASLTGGTDRALTDGDIQVGYDQFSNADLVDISLVVTGAASNTVQKYVISNVSSARKDCIAFISPPRASVVNNAGDETTDIAAWLSTVNIYSSYAFADSGWKYQYDKYNNIYRWIPLNGDIAGLCVRTDDTRDPWFSPAGFSRGAIKNVVKLAWNPNQAERDALYSGAVNPVVSFPGQGTVLYGDKTLLTQPSVFSRINVRRLFIVLEKAIATASKYSLFELNDEFTRSQFVALVEPFLRDVKGRRGIYEYRVVCDTTNNTAAVIDANKFVGDIYIKPARSINFIQLNFVAVQSGVNFTEVVGAI